MDLTTLIQLDKQLLLSLNGSESLFLDGLVRTLTTATTWIPLYIALLFIVMKNNDSAQKVLLVVGCALLCVFFAGSLNDIFVKPAVERWRPSRDGEIGILIDIVNGYRSGRFGFFSSHASNTFSLAIFFSLLIRNRNLSVALILWALLNGWTLIYLGVHFPGDVLCGLLWGAVVGVSMWYIHLRLSKALAATNKYISSQYTSTGYALADVNIVIVVLAFTLVYAIFRACVYMYL